MKGFELLAAAFVAQGTQSAFVLLGDSTMRFVAELDRRDVRLVHVRHENSAIAMADGYEEASGETAVACVTSGPGITQIATALTSAVRRRCPMVVVAGDTSTAADYALHAFDQEPFVRSTGALFLRSRSPSQLQADVRKAFYLAQKDSVPVVLSVPVDLQEAEVQAQDETDWSAEPWLPRHPPIAPDPREITDALDVILAAKRPVILAGWGARKAQAALVELGARMGALLATTIRGKGMFDGRPLNAGIAGDFATPSARALLAEADCVIAVGASLGHFTVRGGQTFPKAEIVVIDVDPEGLRDYHPTGRIRIRGDALLSVSALLNGVQQRATPSATGYREEHVEPTHSAEIGVVQDLEAGVLDPRAVFRELDLEVPKDWRILLGSGHFWGFGIERLQGRSPDRYSHTGIYFGPIGQGLPYGMGLAAAAKSPVVLIEGDGSLMMSLGELETLARSGLKLCVCVMNDGAYGAEVHKLASMHHDRRLAMFGRPDFTAIARAMDIPATRVDADNPSLRAAIRQFQDGDSALLIDVHVSSRVPTEMYRRVVFGE